MPKRKKHVKTEYEEQLHEFHEKSKRHVLVLEVKLSHNDKTALFHMSDIVRKAGNDVTGIMKKRLDQLLRTKKYRNLQKLYGKYKEAQDEKSLEKITKQMRKMQKEFKVTKTECVNAMQKIKDRYGLNSIFALSKAEDIWRGVESCLYRDGKTLRFSKKGELPAIKGKQISRGITLTVENDSFIFHVETLGGTKRLSLPVIIKDRFQRDEANAILQYLGTPEVNDRHAVETYEKYGRLTDTYRPCYASIVCEEIRGRMRVYIHLTLEGDPVQKYDSCGRPRHVYNKGVIGCDIGTQTIAYTSDKEVGLQNLAERGMAIRTAEREEYLINRKMDRSRRATNPDNYNADGTIKRGPKKWSYSKRYKQLRAKRKELCRKNAINRHLAINEDVNHLRSLGDTFVTEPKNAKKLQKRAKETTVNSKGRYNRKKRYGRSIKNRCPGYFQAQARRVFERTGGTYIEVSNNYRASQYDHTKDDYEKKKLSCRMFRLSDQTTVQRDWYSSFLLHCINLNTFEIDKDKCREEFSRLVKEQDLMIDNIKRNRKKICNSGIKAA